MIYIYMHVCPYELCTRSVSKQKLTENLLIKMMSHLNDVQGGLVTYLSKFLI